MRESRSGDDAPIEIGLEHVVSEPSSAPGAAGQASDLQQARTTANLFLALFALLLAFTQMLNPLVVIVIACASGAVMFGRGGVFYFVVPLTIVANSLVMVDYSMDNSTIQLPDIATAFLLVAYLALASGRLELGRMPLLALVAGRDEQRIEHVDRYVLNAATGIWGIILGATVAAFIVLQLMPFRNISPSYTGLIRTSTRMLVLIWAMAIPYLLLQVVFRRMRWRREGSLESRMYVLQTLGDYVGAEQDAVERGRRKRREQALRRAGPEDTVVGGVPVDGVTGVNRL